MVLQSSRTFNAEKVDLSKVRTTLVLGSGGHTAELLGLVGLSLIFYEIM